MATPHGCVRVCHLVWSMATITVSYQLDLCLLMVVVPAVSAGANLEGTK